MKMYRVLIVDDESYVVDWISDLLESQIEPEFDICRAYSVTEALEWLNRAKIDIIITDIKMPKMSGIELSQKVRENWPQCKIIMLTAYSEFDYAYESIKNNVVSYILKDEDDAHILAQVRKATDLLDEESRNAKLLNDTRKQVIESVSVVRNELVIGLLSGSTRDISGIIRQLNDIGVHFDADAPFLLFITRLEGGLQELEIVERYNRFSSVMRLANHYFYTNFNCCFAENSKNSIICIMQTINKEQIVFPVVIVGGTLETIQQACMDTLGLRVSFALYGAAEEASRLPEAMQSLEDLLLLQPDDTAFIITVPDSVRAVTIPSDSVESSAIHGTLAGKLVGYLTADRPDEFKQALEVVCKRLENCVSWQDNNALELYYASAVAIVSYISRRKLNDKIAYKTGLDGLFRPYESGSWKNAADNLRRLSEAIFQLQRESEGQLPNNITLAVKNYINGHITEDVSLIKLSEVAGYNATYLSHLFREQTGITLKEYISRQKLVRITELMSDLGSNINDVALKAGFESRTYFNNFIRRMTGMSPQEYRAQLRLTQKM
jgi:two-component system, response regulator YesN